MRAICVAYIELVRGVPLITVLFMASVMLPLFLPTGMTIDKLLRAQVAFILFAAAYLAEVVRGGLQAIPKGQIEAADALGLGYWQRTRLIVLPQALSLVIPPLVNTFIGTFKDTSLVIIIGLFDLLGTANAALTDAELAGLQRRSLYLRRRRSISRSAFSCRATARCWSASSTAAGGARAADARVFPSAVRFRLNRRHGKNWRGADDRQIRPLGGRGAGRRSRTARPC